MRIQTSQVAFAASCFHFGNSSLDVDVALGGQRRSSNLIQFSTCVFYSCRLPKSELLIASFDKTPDAMTPAFSKLKPSRVVGALHKLVSCGQF